MKQKLFVLLAVIFILIANTSRSQSAHLDVNDISWPSTLNLNIGEVDEFVYRIKNTGLTGNIDTIVFKCTKNTNINYFKYSGNTIFYLTYYNDSVLNTSITKYFYNIFSAHAKYLLDTTGLNFIDANMLTIATGKGYLAPGDSVILHIPFAVSSCGSSNGKNIFFRDSSAVFKDTVTEDNSISVQAGSPALGASDSIIDSASFCATLPKHFYNVKFNYKNNGIRFGTFPPGNAQADSLRIYLYCNIGVGTIETSSIKINDSAVLGSHIISYNTGPYHVYVIDLTNYPAGTNGHPFGYNTVCDMDGRGFADGLAEDSTFELTAKFLYDSTNCPPYISSASPSRPCTFLLPAVGTLYTNMCYTDPYDSIIRIQDVDNNLPGQASYEYQSSTSPLTNASAPEDVTSSSPDFDFTVCPHFGQSWTPQPFNFDCPNQNWSIVIPLPLGFHLNQASANLIFDSASANSYISALYKYGPFLTDSSTCTGDTFPFPAPIIYEHFNIDSTEDNIVINLGHLHVSHCGTVDFDLLSCITVPLELDCPSIPSQNIYTPSDKELTFYLVYTCDSGCVSCQDTLTADSAVTYYHCPGSCTSIPYTDSVWSFLRTNLGSVNEDSTIAQYYTTCNLPYYQPGVFYPLTNTVPLNYESGYGGDQIEAKVNGGYGGLVPADYANEYLQIRYFSNIAAPNLFELDPDIQSYFIVHGLTGTLSPLNGQKLILPPTITVMTDGDLIEMNFSLTSAIQNTYPALYDTLIADTNAISFTDSAFIHLRVMPAPVLSNSVSYGVHLLNLRTEFMCKINGADLSGDTVHSCDSWGRKFNIYKPNDGLGWLGIPTTNTYCDTFSVGMGIGATGALYWSVRGSDFPFEFRPYYAMDSLIQFTIPPGYLFSSAQLTVGLDNHDNVSAHNNFSGSWTSYTIPITHYTRDNFGNNPNISTHVTFTGLNNSCWPLIDQKYTGTYYPTLVVNLNLLPVCSAPLSDTLYCLASATVCTQQPDTNFQVKEGPKNYKMVLAHQNPIISVTPPGEINDYSNLISFTFNTCDVSGSEANNVWLAFENFNHYELNLSTAKLRDSSLHIGYTGSIYYNADTGIIFNIGSLNSHTCDTLVFSADVDSNSISCPPPIGGDSGKVLVRFGNLCFGKLYNPDSTLCQDSTNSFSYNVYPASLSLSNEGYSPVPVSLCGGLLVDSLTISSNELGTILNPAFWVSFPPGVKLDSVLFAYPCGGKWDTTIYKADLILTNSIGGIGAYGWNLDSDLHINGLQGTLGKLLGTVSADSSSGLTSDSSVGTAGSGTIGSTSTNPINATNTVCVKVYMTMNCTYNDSAIKFYTIGTTTCGYIDTASANVYPSVDSSCCQKPFDCYLRSNYDTIIKDTDAIYLARAAHTNMFGCLKVLIEGVFKVDTDFYFNACDVSLAPNALIEVVDSSVFTIDQGNCSPGCSHVHAACDTMWRGIFVHPGSTLFTIDETLIEDADTAVYAMNTSSSEGLFNLNVSTFNKNYKDIVVSPCPGKYHGNSFHCIYTCRDLDSILSSPVYNCVSTGYGGNWGHAPFATLKAPFIGQRTAIGWEIDTVKKFIDTLSSPSPYAGENTFDNMDEGIVGKNSSMFIYSDKFQYINSAKYTLPAIYSESEYGLFDTLVVGGKGEYLDNTFRHCTTGVVAADGFSYVDISYNNFHFDTTSAYNTFGIITTGPMMNAATMTIDSNIIDSASIGIICVLDQNGKVLIDSNTIVGSNSCGTGTGIELGEFGSPSIVYSVKNNAISNLNYGVYVGGLMNDTISWNTIFLNDTLCSTATGIGAFNDNGDQIIGNTVSMNNHSNPSDYASDNFTGIYAEMSQNCFITCNQTNYLTTHIQFYDDQTFNGVLNNTMTSGNNTLGTGIELMGSTIALGAQGSPIASSDNQWSGGFNCKSSVPLPANPALSIFYIRNGAIYNPDSGLCIPPIDTFPAVAASLDCSTLRSMVVLSHALMDSIAKSRIAYLEYPDTAKRISKQALASTLWNKQELLAEPTMYHFNDSISGTSLGQLMSVDSMINSKVHYDPTTLLSTATAITPASNIEANMQTVAQVHLQARTAKTKVLTNSQIANLSTVANYCPFTDGIGVYQARTLLAFYNGNFDIYNWINCDRSRDDIHRATKKNTIDSTKNIVFNLYPNPNNGNFTLAYNLGNENTGKVIIYNQMGMKVAEYLLTSTSGNMTISSQNLSQGVYIYKVFTSNEVKVDKFVIMK